MTATTTVAPTSAPVPCFYFYYSLLLNQFPTPASTSYYSLLVSYPLLLFLHRHRSLGYSTGIDSCTHSPSLYFCLNYFTYTYFDYPYSCTYSHYPYSSSNYPHSYSTLLLPLPLLSLLFLPPTPAPSLMLLPLVIFCLCVNDFSIDFLLVMQHVGSSWLRHRLRVRRRGRGREQDAEQQLLGDWVGYGLRLS